MRKRAAITAFLVVFGAGIIGYVVPVQTSEQDRSRMVTMEFVLAQPNAPLAIQGTQSSAELGAYGVVTVKNVSSVAVKEVTFGVFVHEPKQNEKLKPHLEVASPISIALAPGASTELKARVLPMARLNELSSRYPGSVFELGVVAAVLQDGSKWAAPLDKGRFGGAKRQQGASNTPCSGKPRSLLVSLLASAGITDDGGYFTCAATSAPIWCDNNLTSCTVKECPSPTQCPRQSCAYIPPPVP